MLSFENDYSCAATPEIIARLAETATSQYPGYGTDDVCESAKAKIREACACPDAEIFFLVGGTQTNQVVIDTITPAYAGVVAVASGHPNVHEAGAIEFGGHKVLTLPHHDGKIDADELDEYCATFYADGNYTHMVFPGCVYISQATEYGTLYTLAELEAIRKVCTKYDMPLFIDGARLGYGLTAAGTDTVASFLQQAGSAFGLAVEPVEVDAQTLRRAIVSNVPVLVVTQPGTFAPTTSVVVLDDIDKDSRIVLHDPTSPSRSAKSWAFDDITDAAALAFTVHEA